MKSSLPISHKPEGPFAVTCCQSCPLPLCLRFPPPWMASPSPAQSTLQGPYPSRLFSQLLLSLDDTQWSSGRWQGGQSPMPVGGPAPHTLTGLSEGPGSPRALGHRARPPTSTCTSKPSYLEDKLERALLRTSGVSSAEVTRGAASARLSLSDAVSPSTFISGSDSYTAQKQKRKR